MYNYAHIVDGVVVGVQSASESIDSASLIQVVEFPEIGSTYADGVFTAPTHKVEVVRIISTGAMQRRFTIYEELAIENDPVSRIIRSRLFNSGHCDLDFKDVVEGLAVIVNMLSSAPDPLNAGQMLVSDFDARHDELLRDGTPDEAL